MRKFLLFAAFALCIAAAPLAAQSNRIIDEILAEGELSAESAAYLLLSVSGDGPEPASRGEALEKIKDRFSGIGGTVSTGEYAFLLQNALGLPRGFFSSLFPGPRYSFRDLKFLQIIQERSHPDTPLSGERALRILGRALAEKEDRS